MSEQRENGIEAKALEVQSTFDALAQTVSQEGMVSTDQLRCVSAAFLAGGHVLLSGPPGIGKTFFARQFIQWTETNMKRVQFSMDMLPMDITGSYVLLPDRSGTRFQQGPVFCGALLADEINRGPGRVHAALLEAMEESQVTVEGITHTLPESLFVMATQNPRESSGVYELPFALLDRFDLQLNLDYPPEILEFRLMKGLLNPFVNESNSRLERAMTSGVFVSDELAKYAVQVVRRLRDDERVRSGPSPRAGISWMEVAKGLALTQGRTFVTAKDLHDSSGPCLSHRLFGLSAGKAADHVREIVHATPVLGGGSL